jgi:ubiquitin carboxyl-terminal hydrolase 34
VVVHRGNANFGHYTSLINVNRNDPNRPERNQDEWMEFDDSKISPFNMKNFEDECFGTKVK